MYWAFSEVPDLVLKEQSWIVLFFCILLPIGSRVGWMAFPIGITPQCGILVSIGMEIGIMNACSTSRSYFFVISSIFSIAEG